MAPVRIYVCVECVLTTLIVFLRTEGVFAMHLTLLLPDDDNNADEWDG